jgi:hypothetical protein
LLWLLLWLLFWLLLIIFHKCHNININVVLGYQNKKKVAEKVSAVIENEEPVLFDINVRICSHNVNMEIAIQLIKLFS